MAKPTASDDAGSFMRLQVISMLKLATLVLLATLSFLFFIVLGYGASPSPTATDFTSASSRCTSEFSPSLFTACAAATNVTVAAFSESIDNSSASSAVVDQLLRLDESDQVDVLGCMLDACSSTTQRPLTVADPDAELLFAHYAFNVSGLTQANRFVVVSVAFPNADVTQDTSFTATLTPHLRGYYNGSQRHADLLLPTDQRRSHEATVTCLATSALCEPVHFLRLADLDYDAYRVDVLLNATAPLPLNGRDPMFYKTWGTKAFTRWMLGIKLFFLLASLASCGWFFLQTSRLAATEQTLEQGWIAALAVALVLFNDPFYALEAATGGNALRFLSVLFQATFLVLLLLFWLLALDNLRLEGRQRGVSNATFFLPKVVFAIGFYCAMVAYHAFLKFQTTNDPTWDPLQGNETVALLRALLALSTIVYFGWCVVLMCMSVDVVRALRPRYKYLLALSLWVEVVAFMSVGDGAVSPTPTRGGAWTATHALLNIYAMALQYLFAPSATAVRAARQRAQQQGKEQEPEATPALRQEDAEEDAATDRAVEVEFA